MTAAAVVLERQTQGEFGGPDPAAERAPLPAFLGSAAAHAAAALLLVWPAFWNGFPLVFADTGTYLGQSLLRYLGWDRPPFYSFMLLALHWRVSLWLPVLAQGLLMAHLLGLVLRTLGRTERWALPLAAAALALGTPLPWFVAQLMPDFFAGVVLLTHWLLGFRLGSFGRATQAWVMLLATVSVVVHQSHLPLALGLAAAGGLLLAWRRGWAQALRPALRMALPALLSAAALLGLNVVARGTVSLAPYGAVFLATRVIYDGPGLAVARRRCPEVGWKLCGVLDKLPGWHNGFLWGEDSPLQHELGGAEAWAPEARAIVAATLRAEPGAMLDAALRNTAEQLALFGLGDGLESWPPPHGPVPVVARFFPHELNDLQHGRQQTGLLLREAQAFQPLHLLVLALGGGVLVFLLVARRQRLPFSSQALAVMVLAMLLGNAAITGVLSGPAARYQARIIWLVPFAGLAMASGLRLMPQPAAAGLRPFTPPAAPPR